MKYILGIVLVSFFVPLLQAADKKPVKVFILAGQSNMEGKGFPEPLAWQISQKISGTLHALYQGRRLRGLYKKSGRDH